MTADKCPETEPVMQMMWAACLSWSLRSKEPNFLEMFQAETGHRFPAPPKHAIEAMVDEATGVTVIVLGHYVDWFNTNVWGGYSGAGSEKTP